MSMLLQPYLEDMKGWLLSHSFLDEANEENLINVSRAIFFSEFVEVIEKFLDDLILKHSCHRLLAFLN